MIDLFVSDETSSLEAVVLGLPEDFGGTPTPEEAYDPKSREHILNNTFPTQESVQNEMDQFLNILKRYEVTVYRPDNIPGLNQIFARDIGFVIDDRFIIPNIIDERVQELDGVSDLIRQIPKTQHIHLPPEARIEGGDVLLAGDRIYIGYSRKDDFTRYKVARTNEAGVDFLKCTFGHKEVIPIELIKSDTIASNNALHLDCCFQPVGFEHAIIHADSFKKPTELDQIFSHYGRQKVFCVTREEMYHMNCNIFSISPEVVVTDSSFARLNDWLSGEGFCVETVLYREIAKMEGLLRCSTMPLRRNKDK